MLTEEIMNQSRYFEGEAPEDWEFIGIYDNDRNYIRYYKDQNGNYHHTSVKKRNRSYGKIVLRKDEYGREFARKVYPQRKRRKRAAGLAWK